MKHQVCIPGLKTPSPKFPPRTASSWHMQHYFLNAKRRCRRFQDPEISKASQEESELYSLPKMVKLAILRSTMVVKVELIILKLRKV